VWSAVIRFRCGVLKFGHGIVHKPDLAALVQCKRLLLKLWLLEEKNYKAYFFSLGQAFDHTTLLLLPSIKANGVWKS
jgi:hypothetical protein